MLLELLCYVTKEGDLKVFEYLYALKDPSVKQGSHFDFEVLVQHGKHLLLIHFHCLFRVENVLKVASDLESKFFGDVLSDQELIHISHLLLVLGGIHVVP